MDVLIESARSFEQDLDRMSGDEKAVTVEKINDCVGLFMTQKADAYHQLRSLPIFSALNGYESSLHTLEVSQSLKVILAVDEDPIFGQVIFTLFRVVTQDDLGKAYQDTAESLYRDLLYHNREIAQVS